MSRHPSSTPQQMLKFGEEIGAVMCEIQGAVRDAGAHLAEVLLHLDSIQAAGHVLAKAFQPDTQAGGQVGSGLFGKALQPLVHQLGRLRGVLRNPLGEGLQLRPPICLLDTACIANSLQWHLQWPNSNQLGLDLSLLC